MVKAFRPLTLPSKRMSWIQIDDPVSGIYYECNARTHVCESSPHEDAPPLKEPPSVTKSGPVWDSKSVSPA